MSFELEPLNEGRHAVQRRIIAVCLALCLLVGGLPAASAATSSDQSADDCEINLDPPTDAEYDVHVVGYAPSTNTYHVALTYTGDEPPCNATTRNHLRAIWSDRANYL